MLNIENILLANLGCNLIVKKKKAIPKDLPTENSTVVNKMPAAIWVGFAILSILFISQFAGLGLTTITTSFGVPSEQIKETGVSAVKIVVEQREKIGTALFDIILEIPQESLVISPSEELVTSMTLINFGEAGDHVDVELTYIVTSKDTGEVVYIEHEDRYITSGDEFLKLLELQKLPPGGYNLFVEMIYSDTWASSSAEFRIARN